MKQIDTMYEHAYEYGLKTYDKPYECPYPKGSIFQELYDFGRVAANKFEAKKISDIQKIMKRREK